MTGFSLNLSPSPVTNKIMNTIKTVKSTLATKITTAAFQASSAVFAKHQINEDSKRLAFGEAWVAALQVATGDNFSDMQKYEFAMRGFTKAQSEFQD